MSALLLSIGRAISAAFDWGLRHPSIVIMAVLVLNLGTHLLVIDPRLRSARTSAIEERDTARAERDAEIAAHKATKETYRHAQAEAARLEAERIVRVQSQQQEITDAVTADYRARLADARVHAERLRQQLAPAGEHPAGAGANVAMSGPGDTARRTDEAASDHGLSVEERLIATEQAIQLNALIDWVERQSAVPIDPPSVPAREP